jgi:hypothetical protein
VVAIAYHFPKAKFKITKKGISSKRNAVILAAISAVARKKASIFLKSYEIEAFERFSNAVTSG